MAAAALLLAGCGGGGRRGGDVRSAGAVATPDSAVGWTGREKVGEAIALLDRGEAKKARKVLLAVLKRQPNDSIAADLLAQIDGDPQALLGSDSFTYTTRAGDTMSGLANRFLRNPMRSYALARYNGIDDPSSLTGGHVLRIPGKEKVRSAAPERSAKPRAERPATPAVAAPADRPPAPPPSPARKTDSVRAARLRAAGLEEMNRGRIDRAVLLLRQATALAPGNALISRDLERAMRIRRAVQAKP